MVEEYEDAADYLTDLRNRRVVSGEVTLLWQILWQTHIDLNQLSYRTACLMFLESEHFQRICELLDLNPMLVKAALLSARSPKPTKRGRVGGRKRKPIVWATTFNSKEIGVISNVNVY